MTLKLKLCHETKTYISDQGYFVIVQENWQGEELTVRLSPDQIRAIAAYAEANRAEHDLLWSAGVNAESEV